MKKYIIIILIVFVLWGTLYFGYNKYDEAKNTYVSYSDNINLEVVTYNNKKSKQGKLFDSFGYSEVDENGNNTFNKFDSESVMINNEHQKIVSFIWENKYFPSEEEIKSLDYKLDDIDILKELYFNAKNKFDQPLTEKIELFETE